MENPEAAAFAFIKVYPEAAPRGVSLDDQIKSVSIPINKRSPLFVHYDKSITEFGRTAPPEWDDEIEFLGLQGKIKDPASFYTNELIAEINRLDKQAITTAARSFKVPAR